MGDTLPTDLVQGEVSRVPAGQGLPALRSDPQGLDGAEAECGRDDGVSGLVDRSPATHRGGQRQVIRAKFCSQVGLGQRAPGTPGGRSRAGSVGILHMSGPCAKPSRAQAGTDLEAEKGRSPADRSGERAAGRCCNCLPCARGIRSRRKPDSNRRDGLSMAGPRQSAYRVGHLPAVIRRDGVVVVAKRQVGSCELILPLSSLS